MLVEMSHREQRTPAMVIRTKALTKRYDKRDI
jgi:hypothetical protein